MKAPVTTRTLLKDVEMVWLREMLERNNQIEIGQEIGLRCRILKGDGSMG